ncbi:MAG: YrhA family protein [Alphaproteobacteria bacterium]|nr:YrhA family protein [Alphaproteobacteria bacterium]
MNIVEVMLKLGLAEPNGADKEQIEACQQKLYHAKRALIPLGYTHFLQKSNGVQTDTLSLFGIQNEQSGFVRDIFEVNTIAGTTDDSDQIFLGDNFKEYLAYSWAEKCYLVMDKKTLNIAKKFPLFDHAMVYFLRDYIEKA